MSSNNAIISAGRSNPLLGVLMALLAASTLATLYALVTDFQHGRTLSDNMGMAFALATMVLEFVIAFFLLKDANRRLAEQEAQNEQNQKAILQLLDELADLAKGDLRVHASVTENFTGAIADSINFAIDQMRRLVANINRLSVKVAGAAE